MMTNFGPLNHTQAKALAGFIATLREWDRPGIEDALGRARNRGDAIEVAVAAIRCAGRIENRTPAVIPLDGEHWRTPAGSDHHRTPYPPKRGESCPRHPGEWPDRCRCCAADRLAADTTTDARPVEHTDTKARMAAVRAALHATQETP